MTANMHAQTGRPASCKYDRDAGEYLRDGEPCKRDEYGDPTRHCTMTRSCSNHVGPGELTCARCLGRVRAYLKRIPTTSRLMMLIALEDGVNSEAANLAGPAADPEAWSWRKVAARQGKAWHLSLIEEDDEEHPYTVLGRWDMMIRQDYDHPSDERVTIANAAAYLERQLGRIAQDEGQDFPLMAREIRKCHQHLERVLQTAQMKQRGAPCPDCTTEESGVGPRLVREYGHWCEEANCERLHFLDDTADQWVCPRNREHAWGHEAYTNWIEERRAEAALPKASCE